jgi:hypothetical protein
MITEATPSNSIIVRLPVNGLILQREITTLSTAPAQSVRSSLPARHPLVSYFLIAFGFSWLMFLPGPLMYYGVISLSDDVVRLLAITGLLGPMFHSPIVLGSYLNLAIVACALALVLIAATRGRMGYRAEGDTVV